MVKITLRVNGNHIEKEVADNTLLVSLLRENLNLTGTHVGCDTSQCGSCVVHVDGKSVKSCAMLAADANGSAVTTIEGLEKGKPVTFQNSTYWMGPEVIISTAEQGRVRAFGRVWDFEGRSAELCKIKWGTH